MTRLADMKPMGINVCYTGGTKAMAVHAVRAVAAAFSDRPLAFSYIDAQRDALQVTFGGKHDKAGHTLSVGLRPRDLAEADRDQLSLGLASVLDLHSWRFESYWEAPIFPRAAEKLLSLYATGNGNHRDRWTKWAWSRDQADDTRPVEMPEADCLSDFVAAWRADIEELPGNERRRIDPSRFSFRDLADVMPDPPEADRWSGHPDRLDFIHHWLKGAWLESAVMDILCQLRAEEDNGINYALMGARAKGTIVSQHRGPEFDCLAMTGYRLTLVSCTTNDADPARERNESKYREAKLKLFEAIARGRQLGGDETRIALLCPARPKIGKHLEDELNEDFGAGRLACVFHAGHMTKLKQELRDWLTGG
ncbi:hypothetical protein HN766_27665 [Candidatus Poribacteria bacterium]|nr:hypothetical protein [Candidatus Poribacteria bacterium]